MHKRQAIAVAPALLGLQEIAFAESADASAKAMMGSCRDLVNASQLNGVGQAKCLGIVRAMHYFARYYFGACTPERATIGQTLVVIVRYIDERPERMSDGSKTSLLKRFWRLGRAPDESTTILGSGARCSAKVGAFGRILALKRPRTKR